MRIESYLEAVDLPKGIVRFFSSNKNFKSSEGVLIHVNNLLAKSALKIEEEFWQLMSTYSKPIKPDRLFDFLPKSLRPPKDGPEADQGNASHSASIQKLGYCYIQDPNTNSSKNIATHLDSLRVTFDIVCDISRSTKNSLITKQKLLHSILANNLEIEETEKIEEQLHILEDLSPDWISKKVVHGGEILYSIKQIPDQKSVRERLVEAI